MPRQPDSYVKDTKRHLHKQDLLESVQVLDEIGIDAVSGAVSAPKHRVAAQAAPAASAADSGGKDAELEAMLAQLRS